MNKILATALASAGLLGGGLALSLSPAQAQEGSPATEPGVTVETPDADDTEHNGRRGGHKGHGRRGAGGGALAEVLGMSTEDLRTALSGGLSLADVAAAQGVTSDALVDALAGQAQEKIDAAVESGRIDADAAAEKSAELETRIENQIDRVAPTAEDRAERRSELEAKRDALADLLGVTADELHEARHNGDTLADIATANDVDPQTVIDAIVAEKQADIDAKVASGDLTAEEAAEKSADLVDRVTTMVNEGGKNFEGHGHKRGKGHGHHRGHRGAAPADAGFRTGGAAPSSLPAA